MHSLDLQECKKATRLQTSEMVDDEMTLKKRGLNKPLLKPRTGKRNIRVSPSSFKFFLHSFSFGKLVLHFETFGKAKNGPPILWMIM